jgi:dihydrofolate reductase
MTHIAAIFARDRANGIGKDNALPWPRHGEDMKFFRDTTRGHAVIMGHSTWKSLPLQVRPMPNRFNIVLTRNPIDMLFEDASANNYVMAQSVEEALKFAQPYKQAYVIGGAQVLEAFKSHINEFIVTEIPGKYECDTFVPEGLMDGFGERYLLTEFSDKSQVYSWVKNQQEL